MKHATAATKREKREKKKEGRKEEGHSVPYVASEALRPKVERSERPAVQRWQILFNFILKRAARSPFLATQSHKSSCPSIAAVVKKRPFSVLPDSKAAAASLATLPVRLIRRRRHPCNVYDLIRVSYSLFKSKEEGRGRRKERTKIVASNPIFSLFSFFL